MQNARQRQIVEVMARRVRKRPLLPPAGQPRIDETRIAGEHGFRSEAEPLHHARPEALQQHVGRFRQREHGLDGAGLLEVERGRAPAPVQQVGARMDAVTRPHPVDAQHIRAHVRQQHGAMRPRPDAGDLQHTQAGQRPGHAAVSESGRLTATIADRLPHRATQRPGFAARVTGRHGS